MTEKKCKYCSMMIPSAAKICPYCRKPQGWTTCAKAGLIGILFIVLIPVLSNIGKAPKNTSSPASQNIQQEIQLTDKGKKIKAKRPSWSNEICNIIATKNVQIGMTTEMVIAAWGKPYRNNRTVTMNRTHEQWVYGDRTYLYFEEGILTSWQD